jgi:hypothetical protein
MHTACRTNIMHACDYFFPFSRYIQERKGKKEFNHDDAAVG